MPKAIKTDLQLLADLAKKEAQLRADAAALQTQIALAQKAQREALARERDRLSLALGHVAFDVGLQVLDPTLWQAVCAALPAFLSDPLSVDDWLKLWGAKPDVPTP